MKEKINEKLESITNYILEKETKDITVDDYNILTSELTKIELKETKEEREKDNNEMVQAMTKVLMNRS